MDASDAVMNSIPGRVVVAMSGGVDSSTAAAILKEQGYDLVAFSMQLWDQKRSEPQPEALRTGRCCSLEDLYDARAVAARLNVPFYVINLQKEFAREVVKPFMQSYRDGCTPSPCVLCNSRMKFEQLMRVAEEVQASHIATGHYARVVRNQVTCRYELLKGCDSDKDQSYFLFELRQDQLAKVLFPLGELDKARVRQMAQQHGLEIAQKSESQEICFIPDGDYAGFIERESAEAGEAPGSVQFEGGEIVDIQGRVLGRHHGVHRYTVGQRRGLGIAHTVPLYVVELQPEKSRVVVGERVSLAKKSCRVVRLNWISYAEVARPLHASVKIRSRHRESPATLTPLEDGALRVDFDSPQMAVTPGQAAVFYRGEKVLGGGWIEGNAESS